MITVDITLLIHIINIIVLIAVMNAVLYRPIRGILLKRKEEVTTLENDISTFEKNALLRVEELEEKLNVARAKAKEQLDSVKRAAQDSSNEKVAAVRKESDDKKAAELDQIQNQYNEAETALKGELSGFANEMAGKILGRAVA
jgi:F-type H+-transporting ATPase subunit b